MHRIQSPLLRLLVQLFGSLGLQLVPPSLVSTEFFLAQFTWNFLLMTLFYSTFLRQMFSHENVNVSRGQLTVIEQHKPLMRLLHTLSHYFFSVTIALNLLYFLLMSLFSKPTVLHLLDSNFLFSNCDANKSSSATKLKTSSFKTHFAFIFALNSVFFLCIFPLPALSTKYSCVTKVLKLFSAIFGQYLFNAHTIIIVINIVQYFKVSVFLELRNLNFNVYQHNYLFINSQIRSLSTRSDQFSRLMSFPLLLAVFNHIFSFILNLSAFIYGIHLNSWTNLTACSIDFLSLTVLDQIIGDLLLKLECRLKSHRQVRACSSDLIKCAQLQSIYQSYFTTQLFSICTIDNAFWLTTVVFVVGQIVLVTQTNA